MNNSHMMDKHWTNISCDGPSYCKHNELLTEIDTRWQVCLSRLKRMLCTNLLWVPNAPECGYRWTNIWWTLVTWWTNNGWTSHMIKTNTLYELRNGHHVLLPAPHIATPITITYHDPYILLVFESPVRCRQFPNKEKTGLDWCRPVFFGLLFSGTVPDWLQPDVHVSLGLRCSWIFILLITQSILNQFPYLLDRFVATKLDYRLQPIVRSITGCSRSFISCS
jgi:hypothetical protein